MPDALSRHERRLRHPIHRRIRAVRIGSRMELVMQDNITVTGVVATTPRHVVTPEKLPVTTFRLASTQRRFDRTEQKWVDADTNWFSVATFRQLAVNLVGSIDKGQRVVVSGRLQIKEWNNGEKSGRDVEIVADAIGHDLSWGTSVFTRVITSGGGAPAVEEAGEESGDNASAGASATDESADPTTGELLEFPEARPLAIPF
jgi:single-strand DNA-binding protein